jgi:hypothetical protein
MGGCRAWASSNGTLGPGTRPPARNTECVAALKLVEGGMFDAATLDINLGTETSYRIADELQRRHIPFIC